MAFSKAPLVICRQSKTFTRRCTARWITSSGKDPEGDSIVDPTAQINYRGDFYWPVAFTEDFLNFDRFAHELWECQTLSFEQVMLPVLPHIRTGSRP